MYNGAAPTMSFQPPHPGNSATNGPDGYQNSGFLPFQFQPTAASPYPAYGQPMPGVFIDPHEFQFFELEPQDYSYNIHDVRQNRAHRVSDGDNIQMRPYFDHYEPVHHFSSPDWDQESSIPIDGDSLRPRREFDRDNLPPNTRLFIKGIDGDRLARREVSELFEKYGKILEVSLKDTYGFVQFDNADSVRRAIQGEDGRILKGMRLALEVCKHRPRFLKEFGERTFHDSIYSLPSYTSSRRDSYGRRGDHYRPDQDRREQEDSAILSPSGEKYISNLREIHDPFFRERFATGGPERPRDALRDLRTRDFRPYDRLPPGRRNSAPEREMRDREIHRIFERQREWENEHSTEGMEAHPSYPSRHEHNRSKSLDGIAPPVCQILIIGRVDLEFLHHIEIKFSLNALTTRSIYKEADCDIEQDIGRVIVEGSKGVLIVDEQHAATGTVKLQVFERTGGDDTNVKFDEYESITVDDATSILLLRTKGRSLISHPFQQQSGPSPALSLLNYFQQPPSRHPPVPNLTSTQNNSPTSSSQASLSPKTSRIPYPSSEPLPTTATSHSSPLPAPQPQLNLDVQSLASILDMAGVTPVVLPPQTSPLKYTTNLSQDTVSPESVDAALKANPNLMADFAARAMNVLESLKQSQNQDK